MKKSTSGNLEFRMIDSKVYVLASVVRENKAKFVEGFINKPEVQNILEEFALVAKANDEVE